MKKLLVFLSAVTLFAACTNTAKKENEYLVKGKIEGAATEKVTLSIREDGQFIPIDSVKMENGAFKLQGNIESPEMCYLFVEGNAKPLAFFLENSTIEIMSYADSLTKGKITGSATNEAFDLFNKGLEKFQQELSEWYAEYKQARGGEDKDKIEALENKYNEINDRQMSYIKGYVKDNTEGTITPYIIRRHLIYSMDEKQLDSTLATLDKKLATLKDYKFIEKRIEALRKVAVGEKFTDFTLDNPEGEPFTLSSVVGGKYILLDFWASWCSPCRQENPNVVKMYKKFHDKGFDIVGISLDRNKERWMQAIESDGLVWHHCSDLQGWQNKAAKMYAVSSIPHTVLLDKEGVILAKNLRGEALEEKLAELLK